MLEVNVKMYFIQNTITHKAAFTYSGNKSYPLFFMVHFKVKRVKPTYMFCFAATRIYDNKQLTTGV